MDGLLSLLYKLSRSCHSELSLLPTERQSRLPSVLSMVYSPVPLPSVLIRIKCFLLPRFPGFSLGIIDALITIQPLHSQSCLTTDFRADNLHWSKRSSAFCVTCMYTALQQRQTKETNNKISPLKKFKRNMFHSNTTVWNGPGYGFETVLFFFFKFLLRCWLCAAGWKLRLPSYSVHINMLRGFGTVIACSVPSWRTKPLGREHMPWVGNTNLLCCPSGSVRYSPQKTESAVLRFRCWSDNSKFLSKTSGTAEQLFC